MTESTLTPDRSAEHPDIKRRDTRPRPATLLSSKIHAQHLERLAIVYVRQSSARQVEENIESTQMQYQLVDRATALGRIIFTRDRDFLAEAVRRQRAGLPFATVVYARQRHVSIGQCVEDLELIAKTSTPDERRGNIVHLPL